MLPYTIKDVVLRTVILFLTISFVNGQDRRIKAELNPGCKTCTENTTLMYIRADGGNDTIHQLWDFTAGIPMVIFAVASLQSQLNITWDKDKLVNLTFNETPMYTFATLIDKLVEYDDIEDKGHIDETCPQREYNMWDVTWTRAGDVIGPREALLRVHGHYDDRGRSGIIDFKLDMIPFRDYASELPHLIHTANSSLIDVRLVNVTTSPEYNSSRLALRLVILTTERGALHCTLRKSLDDEHTPGVFEIIEVKSPESFAGGAGAFVQFRPVAYTESERSVSSSTNAYITPFRPSSFAASKTLSGVLLRGHDPSELAVESAYVSFGMPGDGFYKQHNFTAWSFTVGYGQPPVESFSLFVIIVIAVGLAVPVLLALSGIVYVLSKRCRQRHQPQRLYDDE